MSSNSCGGAVCNVDGAAARLVKALFDFRPAHTDELAFRKGDVISVTQTLEGGWWEGTLGGLTGWFPSNYVKPLKASKAAAVVAASALDGCLGGGASRRVTASLGAAECHALGLQQWIEQEKRYVVELFRLSGQLEKLMDNGTLRLVEALSNVRHALNELHRLHQSMIAALEQVARRPFADRMVGKEVLSAIPRLQDLYGSFFQCYPRTVVCLERREMQAIVSAPTGPGPRNGLRPLCDSLTVPLRQLDVYCGLLRELSRHLEPSHLDFNELLVAEQRLRLLTVECEQLRRLKMAELDIVRGSVHGLTSSNTQNENSSALGDVVHSDAVRLLTAEGALFERVLILFPHDLFFLSMHSASTGAAGGSCSFQFEERLVLSVFRFAQLDTLIGLDNFEHAFEISISAQDRRVVLCNTRDALERWLRCLAVCQANPAQPASSSGSLSKRSSCMRSPMPLPQPPTSSSDCSLLLRPAPPAQARLVPLREDSSVLHSPRMSRKLARKERACAAPQLLLPSEGSGGAAVLVDDMLVLGVIEAYATQSRARHTMNLLDLTKIRLSDSELRQKQAEAAAFRVSSDSSSSGGGGGGGITACYSTEDGDMIETGVTSSTASTPLQPTCSSVSPLQHFFNYEQYHQQQQQQQQQHYIPPYYMDCQRFTEQRRY